ncbi:MAG: extracellular solute-binding protein, partial [Oscillospiraceae bacterium]|nr:extracellular solute-binding protein [Oscillospiraceae bacterium]
MKKIIALLLALVMVLAMAACGNSEAPAAPAEPAAPAAPAEPATPETPAENPLAGTYDITMWVSEKEGVAEMTQQQIEAFMAANPGIVINASIEGVTEADAGSKVVADVASAPDIFCFAQDQLARLVQAAALAQPGQKATETIIANNDAGSVAAASVAGTLYAYPMTSDNGYYMYYDTSIISEEDAESLEAIIAACEANNVKFRYALENAWYTA